MPDIDVKPRSRVVTDGIEATTSRGMLRAVGMGDEDWEKPQIGIASSWNEITPCNLSLDRLAQGAKEGVHGGGGYPLQFGTISVSDGISMGHEGMHFSLVSREVIADSVETVVNAERLDGTVLLAGCDKSLPGMLMAAARLDLASVFLYAGSVMPGYVKQADGSMKEVTIIDSFEGVGACKAGTMSEAEPQEDRVCDRPRRRRLWRDVHREHHGEPGRGAGHVAARVRRAAQRRPSARLLRAPVRRSRREHAPPGPDRPRRPDPRGVRERDHRAHGARWLDERGAAPARDRARGRGRTVPRRLQPHRLEGPAPGRHEALRTLRDEGHRPAGWHPGGHEGAARRGPAARRVHDRHRQDRRREPGRDRPAGGSTARSSGRSTTRSTRPVA